MTKKSTLIAIDPGLMTGVSIFRLEVEPIPVMTYSAELDLDQYQDFLQNLEDQVSNPENDQTFSIVIEDFIITTETAKKMIGGNWSIELIGKTDYVAKKHGIRVTRQKPGDRMSISHEQLKSLEFWHVGGAGHANQSARHAVVYMLDVLKHKPLARHLIDM